MEIDIPEVVAEVEAAFAATSRRWSRTTSRRSRRCSATIRAPSATASARTSTAWTRSAPFAARARRSTWIATGSRGPSSPPTAGTSRPPTPCSSAKRARPGRPPEPELGALPGRLAGGGGPCERHRRGRAPGWFRGHVDQARLHAAYASGRASGSGAVVREVYASDRGVRRRRHLHQPRAGGRGRRRSAGAWRRSIPEARPLWGLPFAVKDNIDVAGLPTTAACPEFAYHAERDAHRPSRACLRPARFSIGKTNLDQFATGLVGVRSPYPRAAQSVRSAHGAGRVELRLGGRGGARARAASRSAPTRRARAACRRRSTTSSASSPRSAPFRRAASCRPAARSIACRCSPRPSTTPSRPYSVMAGFDPDDPFSHDAVALGALGAPPPSVRIGVPDKASRALLRRRLSEAAFDAALARRSPRGLAIERGRPRRRSSRPRRLLYAGPWVAERYEAIRAFIESRPEALHPVTRADHRDGAARSRPPTPSPGCIGSRDLRRACEPTWAHVDALCVPTYPRPRTLADLDADPLGPNAELGTYTNFVNLLDLCALAVPGRFRADGLPSGVTLIGAGRPRRLPGLARGRASCPCRDAARRDRRAAAEPAGTVEPRPRRRDRACRRRRASFRHGVEPRADEPRRALPARGADDARLPALRARRRPAAPARPAARRGRARGTDRRGGLGALA